MGGETARNEAGKAAEKLQLLRAQLKNEIIYVYIYIYIRIYIYICIYMVQQESIREKDGNAEGEPGRLKSRDVWR